MAPIGLGRWLEEFVAKLRSQIEAENRQSPTRPIEFNYSRHFCVTSRSGRYAKIVWRDGETYELSTATRVGDVVQWQFKDTWRLAADGQQVISTSSGRSFSPAGAVASFLMLLQV